MFDSGGNPFAQVRACPWIAEFTNPTARSQQINSRIGDEEELS